MLLTISLCCYDCLLPIALHLVCAPGLLHADIIIADIIMADIIIADLT